MEPNCLGIEILDNIVVDIVHPAWTGAIELQIEPRIVLHGKAKELAPGVTYNAALYVCDDLLEHGLDEQIGETIAYAINGGGVVSDTIEAFEDRPTIEWRVRPGDVAVLRKHGIMG